MVKKMTIVMLLVLAPLTAKAKERPINLSLVTPIQIFPATDSIVGFRFSLLYGRNANFTGLDLGLANHTTGSFKGVQFGLVGIAESGFLGWQDNFINVTSSTMEGLQVGAVNYAEHARGVQFGLVNYAGTISGIQIGIVNIIRKGGMLPVMVIFNGSF
jgi:predicted transcriptional regulator with HTH domain